MRPREKTSLRRAGVTTLETLVAIYVVAIAAIFIFDKWTQLFVIKLHGSQGVRIGSFPQEMRGREGGAERK